MSAGVPGDRRATLRNVVSAAWPLVRGILQGGRRCSKYTLGTVPSYEKCMARSAEFLLPEKARTQSALGAICCQWHRETTQRLEIPAQWDAGTAFSHSHSFGTHPDCLSPRARGHYSQQHQVCKSARLAYLVPVPFLAYRDTGEAVREGGWWRMRGDMVGTPGPASSGSFEPFVESSTQREAIFMFDSGSAGGFCLLEL
ncbi:hypothetical protein OIDMADRAFT_48627 [Oidiodendron maius Zn]|uniref:Uncharacterized protein n=1 Tax=Oidiodendron maius (strain Zn) TaxID=913774 RepID=A0A0C3I118_OIDMZ|nr:hypothetical protein OIDMADRAFT_48627 [Oidiodendron maius Zn]